MSLGGLYSHRHDGITQAILLSIADNLIYDENKLKANYKINMFESIVSRDYL